MRDEGDDEFWMRHAMMLAGCAEGKGEIPVGAVLVMNGTVIGEGWNSSIGHHDPTAHAEIIALRQAGRTVGNYRLLSAALYVTLEPCIMCIGAMIHARISCLVFGAWGDKSGAARLLIDVLHYSSINHQITVTDGVMAKACSEQLRNFFRHRRAQQHKARRHIYSPSYQKRIVDT